LIHDAAAIKISIEKFQSLLAFFYCDEKA